MLEHFLLTVLCSLCSSLFVFHYDSLHLLLIVGLRVVYIVLRVFSNLIVLRILLIGMQSHPQWNSWEISSTSTSEHSRPDHKLMHILPLWSFIFKINIISIDSFSDHLFYSLYDRFVLPPQPFLAPDFICCLDSLLTPSGLEFLTFQFLGVFNRL